MAGQFTAKRANVSRLRRWACNIWFLQPQRSRGDTEFDDTGLWGVRPHVVEAGKRGGPFRSSLPLVCRQHPRL